MKTHTEAFEFSFDIAAACGLLETRAAAELDDMCGTDTYGWKAADLAAECDAILSQADTVDAVGDDSGRLEEIREAMVRCAERDCTCTEDRVRETIEEIEAILDVNGRMWNWAVRDADGQILCLPATTSSTGPQMFPFMEYDRLNASFDGETGLIEWLGVTGRKRRYELVWLCEERLAAYRALRQHHGGATEHERWELVCAASAIVDDLIAAILSFCEDDHTRSFASVAEMVDFAERTAIELTRTGDGLARELASSDPGQWAGNVDLFVSTVRRLTPA